MKIQMSIVRQLIITILFEIISCHAYAHKSASLHLDVWHSLSYYHLDYLQCYHINPLYEAQIGHKTLKTCRCPTFWTRTQIYKIFIEVYSPIYLGPQSNSTQDAVSYEESRQTQDSKK